MKNLAWRYLLTLCFYSLFSCGENADLGSTSINLSGAQYIAQTQFSKGLMLYVKSVDQDWMRVAINLSNSSGEINFPNGKYNMALVGIKENSGNFESYCGLVRINGNDVVELAGGEVVLSATMSKGQCVTDNLFAHDSFIDKVNNKLRPLRLEGCLNNATTCSDPGTSNRVLSAKVQLNSFKSAPLFNTIDEGLPIEMCINLLDSFPNKSTSYLELPVGNLEKNIFNTTVKLYSAANCNDSSLKRIYEYPSGFFDSWKSKSADMSYLSQPFGSSEVVLKLNTDISIPEPFSKFSEGFLWEIGEFIAGSPILTKKITIENNYAHTMSFNTAGTSFITLASGATGSFGLSGGAWPGTNGDCGTSLLSGQRCQIEIFYSSSSSAGIAAEDSFAFGVHYTVNSQPELLTGVVKVRPLNIGVLSFKDFSGITTISSIWDLGTMSSPTKLRFENTGEATIYLNSSNFFFDNQNMALTDSGHDISFSGGITNPWPGALSGQECPDGNFPLKAGEYCLVEVDNYGNLGTSTYHDVMLLGNYDDSLNIQNVNLRIRGQEP